ncbi:G-protein coupled receptor Mth-like [Drosophila sulfurigaster albostrigata]|uniref:G-protein coupled receptor Mth-like n=1 Tax=Drosophila sulfurigaster albostrigata TaxID=89887 RepID=UPI002D21C43F|nr:G-protein coupled receptor Mth-like [Drosophila sulfurigaster albostrigata]
MWILLLMIALTGINADIPDCDYYDTVRLSEDQKLLNGSYKYQNIIISPELTGEYDYEILMNGDSDKVPRHLRGCACHLGTCIRYCCPKNQKLVVEERRCGEDIQDLDDFDGFVDFVWTNGTEMKMPVSDDLIIQRDLPVPCSEHMSIINKYKWKLLENGNIAYLFVQDNSSNQRSKNRYCLQPQRFDNESRIQLIPQFCPDPRTIWPSITLLILSIVCSVLTIAVYMGLPKLRNLHGICFICYLFMLIVAFLLLLFDKFYTLSVSENQCKSIGYVGYFAVMSTFHWLSVISFNLWKSFRGTNYNEDYTIAYRFTIYSIIVWTSAAVLTLIIFIIDSTLDPDDMDQLSLMPGVAIFSCWIKTHDWSAMLYYYGPMSIQIIFNTTMFAMTAIRIFKVMDEMKNFQGRLARNQRVQSRKEYGLFSRLFIVIGVPWTFEILSYFAQSDGVLKTIFLLFDYINCGQGILIFILFVLKRSVLKQLANSGWKQQNSKSMSLKVTRSTRNLSSSVYKQKECN